MVDQVLTFLPHEAGRMFIGMSLAGMVAGVGLWMAGSRISRPVMTLGLVAAGASAGMHFPEWMGWSISGMGFAVAGAMLLGLAGFILHSMWVTIGLGVLMAGWAGLGTWLLYRREATWDWNSVTAGAMGTGWLQALWQALPETVAQMLPWTCLMGFVSGIALAILWPRMAAALMYSLAGVSLLMVLGLAGMKLHRPEWLMWVPSQPWAQWMVLFSLVGFGAVVQWQTTPRDQAAAGGEEGGRERSDEPAASFVDHEAA
jgi:hypothetical protein